jgi:hypothetical protein
MPQYVFWNVPYCPLIKLLALADFWQIFIKGEHILQQNGNMCVSGDKGVFDASL